MTKEMLNLLQGVGKSVRLPAGKAVFSEGDPCNHFVVLLSGQIKVFKNSERGREIVLYRVSPDHLCVLTTTCMLSHTPYSANAVTETEVEALALEGESFDQLIVESKEFREMVFSSLSQRFQNFVDKIDQVVFHSLKDRLVEFLRHQQDANGKVLMTHQEIAQELGTEREVISRLVTQLRDAGIISTQKGEIEII